MLFLSLTDWKWRNNTGSGSSGVKCHKEKAGCWILNYGGGREHVVSYSQNAELPKRRCRAQIYTSSRRKPAFKEGVELSNPEACKEAEAASPVPYHNHYSVFPSAFLPSKGQRPHQHFLFSFFKKKKIRMIIIIIVVNDSWKIPRVWVVIEHFTTGKFFEKSETGTNLLS